MSESGASGNGEWTTDHQRHLVDVLSENAKRITVKYRKGQQEHGGHLWRKRGMLGHVEAEVTDLNVYLPTLRNQLKGLLDTMDEAMTEGLVGTETLYAIRNSLAAILGEPEE